MWPLGLVLPMVTADVARREPLHPVAEIAVFSRPEDEVEVIGQQAIGQQPHVAGVGFLAKKLDELGIVAGLVEDLGPGISAVENVVTKASGRCSGGSWHVFDSLSIVAAVIQETGGQIHPENTTMPHAASRKSRMSPGKMRRTRQNEGQATAKPAAVVTIFARFRP